MTNDKFTSDLQRVEKAGATRYGDDAWKTTIEALGRAGGIAEIHMRQILAQPDPAAFLHQAGKEQLLIESDSGNHESERAYRRLRNAEREAWRKERGR